MMRKRLAILEAIAQPGGAQISLLETVRRVTDVYDVVLILPEDGPLHHQAVQVGAEVRILEWPDSLSRTGERTSSRSVSSLLRIGAGALAIPGVVRRLDTLLDDVGADVLITNGIKPHILGAATKARRPLIWYLRDGFEGRQVSSRLMSALARRCSAAIAISEYVAREATSFLPSVPVTVIYNIIDFGRFNVGAAAATDLVKATDEIWFGTVGALTPLKGQDLFLRAASSITGALPQARFVVVGTNFYKTQAGSHFEKKLRELAASPPLSGRVRFLGHRDDIPAVLRRLDVLVQSNRGPEALGRSVLEAMACGIPVIAADKWGPAELVQDGETGVLTPVMDVPALAGNMLRLGQDPILRGTLGAAAGEWVQKRLDPAQLANAFKDVVEAQLK